MSKPTVTTIDAILPQTQCGLCTYGACQPYAEALVENSAPINLCPPGGVETLLLLGELLHQDPSPFLDEMREKTKSPTRAVIREDECIGCTKCIQVCPVDAIIGAAKQMHTVISDECTGCDLCLEPCPMDCIDMIPATNSDSVTIKAQANRARERYHSRQKRLAEQEKLTVASVDTRLTHAQDRHLRFDPSDFQLTTQSAHLKLDPEARKTAILESVARAATKRLKQNQTDPSS